MKYEINQMKYRLRLMLFRDKVYEIYYPVNDYLRLDLRIITLRGFLSCNFILFLSPNSHYKYIKVHVDSVFVSLISIV